jgi:hypothetical protein
MFFGDIGPTWWGEGGVSFYNPSVPGITLGRGYAIKRTQFMELLAQENGWSITIKQDSNLWLNGHNFGSRYGNVIRVGENHGVPVVTFTANSFPDPLEPSDAYKKTVMLGLEETYPGIDAAAWLVCTQREYRRHHEHAGV